MGNWQSIPTEAEEDVWWNNGVKETSSPNFSEPTDNKEDNHRSKIKKELEEFKLELARKHEKRRQLISEKAKEMQDLRDEVKRLKEENDELKKWKFNGEKCSNDSTMIDEFKEKNREMKVTIAQLQSELQAVNASVLDYENEKQEYKKHVVALKDVISVSKQMLLIREGQLNELKGKIKEIEASIASNELNAYSRDLQIEYEKQLQNIRNLRLYYEERQRADNKEKENLRDVLEEVRNQLQEERDKNSELTENVARLEEANSKQYDEVKNLESILGLTKAECRQYQAELTVINQLFSQILHGFNNNQEIDIDKLIKLLEENHYLLQDIAINEESNQVSALPKMLLDLVNEVSDKQNGEEESENNEEVSETDPNEKQSSHQLNNASEIAENLPKVWKVLIELLSHQSAPLTNEIEIENPCYKVVHTPKGPNSVLSVSKTFIRLKDLILEKKSLERETCRLKHLNTHLENRLQEQESRLTLVTKELTETWHVVGKLQKRHQLLHTQEKILRYELAQKRKLLNELKEELEYSREKWLEAREKNSNTAKQWEELRIEFASRKTRIADDYNNSVESGYSDDKECSSEDEPEYEPDVTELNRRTSLSNEHENDNVDEVNAPAEEKCDYSENLTVLETGLDEPTCSVLTQENEPNTSSLDFSARDQKLEKLEGMCNNLVQQVTTTLHRSQDISSKLDVLHEVYGEGSEEAEPTTSEGQYHITDNTEENNESNE